MSVTCVLDYLHTNFGLPSTFGSRVIHYVRDRQTDRRTDGRTKATLNAPYPTDGGITRTYSKPLSVLDRKRSITVNDRKSLQAFPTSTYEAKQKESLMPLNTFRYKVFQKAYGPKATAKQSLGETQGFGC